MNQRIKELHDQRQKLIAESRALLDKVQAEGRALTAEENDKYKKIDADIDAVDDTLAAEEKVASRSKAFADALGTTGTVDTGKTDEARTAAQVKAFRSYLQYGKEGMSHEEFRALQADSDIVGGYLVPPQQFIANLIKSIDDEVFIRQLATVYPVTSSDSIGAPSLDADPADAAWTAEIGAISEDSTMAFGARELRPYQLTKLVKVSDKLMATSALPVDTLVSDRLGYKFGVSEEKAFLTGTGAAQPLGVFTASANGISTARDVSTGNAATAVTFDGLINALYSLKGGYMNRATWIFHRDAVKQIRTLKDGDGQYIWQPAATAGTPDLILGRPFRMSEYAPNTFTSGLYVGIVGDFSYYWIADLQTFVLQRLVELYAANGQVGFKAKKWTDGMPVLGEAFARVKLG